MKKQQIFFGILVIQVIVLFNCWDYIVYRIKRFENNKGKYNHIYPIDLQPQIPECAPGRRLRTLIVITSYVGNLELRNYHRQAMPNEYLNEWNATRVFLLGRIKPSERSVTQWDIAKEHQTFKDIIQGSFVDTYKHLTYKHLMGLQWASTKCNNSDYILKLDDDVVFILDAIYEIQTKYDHINKDKVLIGIVTYSAKPRRNYTHKHFVSPEQYPDSVYPPYIGSWLYITSPSLASKLVSESKNNPYFWVDDVFVTGILAKSLGIELIDLGIKVIAHDVIIECCLQDMIKLQLLCNFAWGTNSGRIDRIYDFTMALRNCDNCTKRDETNTLNKTCDLLDETAM